MPKTHKISIMNIFLFQLEAKLLTRIVQMASFHQTAKVLQPIIQKHLSHLPQKIVPSPHRAEAETMNHKASQKVQLQNIRNIEGLIESRYRQDFQLAMLELHLYFVKLQSFIIIIFDIQRYRNPNLESHLTKLRCHQL